MFEAIEMARGAAHGWVMAYWPVILLCGGVGFIFYRSRDIARPDEGDGD